VGQAFTQVKAYITDEGINKGDVSCWIMVLETTFGNPNCVVTGERKLEMLKQTKCDFSPYSKEFQYYAADVQWNHPAKLASLMSGLNNEIKDALALSDNVPQ
jgi:hypothetical protein